MCSFPEASTFSLRTEYLNPFLPFLRQQMCFFWFSKDTVGTCDFFPIIGYFCQGAAVWACLLCGEGWGDCSAGKEQTSSIWAWQTERGVGKRIHRESREGEVIGLAQSPRRRKVRSCRSWSQRLETRLQHKCKVHPGDNWRPAHQYQSSSRDWRLVSELNWDCWAPGQKMWKKAPSEAAQGMTIGVLRALRKVFRSV